MNYFIDTEFHEYKKPTKLLGIKISEIPTIDLISIGIVAEDGREYYAISNEFNIEDAWDNTWLRENVLISIYNDYQKSNRYNLIGPFSITNLKTLINWYGKPNNQIANEIKEFCRSTKLFDINEELHPSWEKHHIRNTPRMDGMAKLCENNHPVFYAYYADYDWVVFCWLFGRMMDLPENFPMYCIDLKQIMDDKGLNENWRNQNVPDPEGEHNALIDARWNMKLFNAIENYEY